MKNNKALHCTALDNPIQSANSRNLQIAAQFERALQPTKSLTLPATLPATLSTQVNLPMAEYRRANPKPTLFDLIHKWNLTEDQKLLLDFYSMKKVTAYQLAENLNTNKGRYSTVTLCNTYIPIYMYTSRRQIERDAQVFTTKHYPYYLSLRTLGNISIVLIQRARYAE